MQIVFIKFRSNDDSFAFVSFERHRSYSEIATILYSDEYRGKINACTAIVLRPAVDKPIKNLNRINQEIHKIIERLPLTPLYILHSSNFEIRLSDNLNRNQNEIEEIKANKSDFINYVRQREMEQFILHSTAIIKSPTPKILFRTPSQEYSHTFLRVGNIQKSRHVLDSIFFWTLPFLKKTGAILTDSWSISSIAFNISRLLARYIKKKDKKMSEVVKNFHVNMLTTHYHGLREMDKETKDCLIPLIYNNNKNILFIISAIKTSKSLGNIKKAIKNAGFTEKMEYLVLYKLISEVQETHLCDLSGEFSVRNDINFDSRPEPEIGFPVIPIDEQSFFPFDARDQLIEIKKAGADISKTFFETYGGKNVISVHRKAFFANNTPLRHHGIYVDVSKMLECDVFLEKLAKQIEKIPKLPACIIYPPHDQGEKLVTLIADKLEKKFSGTCKILCFAELKIEPESKQSSIVKFLKSLSRDQIVLVLDDVSITGDRLHTYQKNLLNNFKGQIRYLVGVARPESEEVWQRRKNILQIKGDTLDYVEKIILPDWDNSNCPWCQERKMLEELIENSDYKELSVTRKLEIRLNELNQSENKGLINNVFF